MNDAVNNDALDKSESQEVSDIQPKLQDLIQPGVRPDEAVSEIEWGHWIPFYIPSGNNSRTIFWIGINKYVRYGECFFIGIDDEISPRPIYKYSQLTNTYGTDNSVSLDQYTFSAQAELNGSSLVVKASYKDPAGRTLPINKTFTVE